MQQVTLFNKNTPVATVWGENQKTSEKNAFPRFVAEKFEYINPKLCPVFICSKDAERVVKEFNEWMKKRVTSGKRQNLPDEQLIKWDNNRPHYFNLTDQYWLQYSADEKWEDLNFFTNQWKTQTGEEIFHFTCRLAKKGFDKYDIITNCPELATPGVASKRWVIENGLRYLIKEPSEKNETEVINEILASKLLQKREFPEFIKIVDYFPYIDNYQICSASECFTTDTVELVTAYDICYAVPKNEREKNGLPSISYYEHLIRAIRELRIPNGEEYIRKVIEIDKWLGNPDRHLCNIAFLRNVETGRFIGPAPIFDFGQAFRSDAKVHYVFERASMDIPVEIEAITTQEIKDILIPLGYSNKHIKEIAIKAEKIKQVIANQAKTRLSLFG